MPTRREILNDGRGVIPIPPVVTEENQLYGETVDEVENDTAWGDFLARIPRTGTGVAVSSDSATLSRRGPVIAVQITAGRTLTGYERLVTGTPAAGQYLVAYDGEGFPTISFHADDGVTEIAVEQLSPPDLMDTFLSESVP